MPVFFIVQIEIPDPDLRGDYDEYVARVRPVVESYGGTYLVRSERVTLFAGEKKPDRVIVVRFSDRQRLDACFASAEYAAVKGLRENSVKTTAVIVEE